MVEIDDAMLRRHIEAYIRHPDQTKATVVTHRKRRQRVIKQPFNNYGAASHAADGGGVPRSTGRRGSRTTR